MSNKVNYQNNFRYHGWRGWKGWIINQKLNYLKIFIEQKLWNKIMVEAHEIIMLKFSFDLCLRFPMF